MMALPPVKRVESLRDLVCRKVQGRRIENEVIRREHEFKKMCYRYVMSLGGDCMLLC